MGSDCTYTLAPAVNPPAEGGDSPEISLTPLPAGLVRCTYLYSDSAELTVSTGATLGHLNILIGLNRDDLSGPAYVF